MTLLRGLIIGADDVRALLFAQVCQVSYVVNTGIRWCANVLSHTSICPLISRIIEWVESLQDAAKLVSSMHLV